MCGIGYKSPYRLSIVNESCELGNRKFIKPFNLNIMSKIYSNFMQNLNPMRTYNLMRNLNQLQNFDTMPMPTIN